MLTSVVSIVVLVSSEGKVLMSKTNPLYIEARTGIFQAPAMYQVPGGKWDKNRDSNYEHTARRELYEETGISEASLAPFGYYESKDYFFSYWIGVYDCDPSKLTVEVDSKSRLAKSSPWAYEELSSIKTENLTDGLAAKWKDILDFISSLKNNLFKLDDHVFIKKKYHHLEEY